jgi:DNA (cytosine-5)-methyltransferase 1
MKVGSLFSGVGGFDLGLERAGMEIAWQVEIDPQSRSVLRHHWPNAELHKDVNDVGRTNLAPVDLICGGFPCQDLSVAGKREGMAGQRSGLWWEFHRILGELTPRWCLIENVPGLLSSNEGRDMLALVDSLEQLGYGWSYRILDSQHFGVAQRRRRVFIVGHLGGLCPPEILLESEGVSWDSEEGEAQGEGAAEGFGRGTEGEGSRGLSLVLAHGQANAEITEDQSPTLSLLHEAPIVFRKAQKAHDPDDHERWEESEVSGTLNGQGDTAGMVAMTYHDLAPTLTADHAGMSRVGGKGAEPEFYVGQKTYFDVTPTLAAGGNGVVSASGGQGFEAYYVGAIPRRLTPTECERLQGFPDGWTRLKDDGTELADSPRYRMMGNAVTVNVAEWIGKRIIGQEKG